MENLKQQTNNSAKFAFFYLLSLTSLIFTALSVGMIIFQIINKSIVDVINQYSGQFSQEQLKFAIATIIIAAPVFYLTQKQIYKNLFLGIMEKDSGIRKWLSYLTLFTSSVITIGWLIATINSFLDGDLTIKFALKAITAIIISSVAFSFYLYDIKREEVAGKKDKIIKIYFFASLILVLASFIASLFFVESPMETRNKKMDEIIMNNFYSINNEINSYYNEFGKIPQTIDELQREYGISDKILNHPESGKKIEYKIVGEKEYELCTDFKTSNKNEEDYYGYYNNYRKENEKHDAGYQCLKQRVEVVNPPILLKD